MDLFDIAVARKLSGGGGGGGGGDLTTASVTFKNVGSGAYGVEVCYLDNGIFIVGYVTVSGDTAVTVPCPFRISLESSFDGVDGGVMPTVSGDVVLSFQDMAVYVNGDGTFTAAGTL